MKTGNDFNKIGFLLSGLGALALSMSVSCSRPKKTDDMTDIDSMSYVDQDPEPQFDPLGSDSGNIAGLQTVNFEFDQSRLTLEARRALANNAEWMKRYPSVTVQIEGHTDERGTVEYNLALGERRARSAKAYLESLGVPPQQITIISYGEEKPIAFGSNEEAWARNRRANFVPLQ